MNPSYADWVHAPSSNSSFAIEMKMPVLPSRHVCKEGFFKGFPLIISYLGCNVYNIFSHSIIDPVSFSEQLSN